MATKTKPKKKIYSKKSAQKKQNKIIAAVSLLLVVVLVVGGIVVKNHSNKPVERAVDFGKDVAVGCDISHHNKKVDFEKLKDEVDFVIIRVGYRGYANGEICLDKKAKKYLKAAKEAGIPVGVYFYSQAITEQEAVEEAKFTIRQIKAYDISLPVFYDFEYASEKGKTLGRLYEANLTPAENTALVNAFCSTVEKAGYMSGLYASTYMYEKHFKVKDFDKNMYIWVADYNKDITYDGYFDVWQYTSKGRLEATGKKNVDKNYWYKR